MSNDVPANAGGMPAISRRAVLIGVAAATLPMTAGAAIADPLLKAIHDYDDAVAVLNTVDEQGDDYETCISRMNAMEERLREWKQPALTREGAMQALRTAAEDMRHFFCDGPTPALVAAALAYFEGERA